MHSLALLVLVLVTSALANDTDYSTIDVNAYLSGTHTGLSYALSGSFYESDGHRDNGETDARDIGLKVPLAYRKREVDQFATFVGGEFEANTEIESATASPQFVIKEPVAGFNNSLTIGFDYNFSDEEIVNRSDFFGSISVARFDLEKKNYGIYIHD